MLNEAPIFKKIYQEYLDNVYSIDFSAKEDKLGISVNDKEITIEFYNEKFVITPQGIRNSRNKKPNHAVCVVLCKYLLLCPDDILDDNELVSYKDFKDAAPYVIGFKNTVEKPVSNFFTGKLELLEKRCVDLGGKPYKSDISCDLAYEFQALPKIPVYLIFNDEDEEFPAECSLLFQRNVQQYLDMECIAMTGIILAERLKSDSYF